MAVFEWTDPNISQPFSDQFRIDPPSPNRPLPAAWTTETAYISTDRIIVRETGGGNNQLQLHLHDQPVGGGGAPGPEFLDDVEASIVITLTSGTDVLVISGITDPSEPYRWDPSNGEEVTAWYNRRSVGDSVTVRLEYPPPGVQQTLNIGAAGVETDDSLQWSIVSDNQIDAAFIAAGMEPAYLRVIGISPATEVQFRTADTPTGPSFASGPQLTSRWEENETAITIAAGALSVVIPGPNAPSVDTRDSTEPYSWNDSSFPTLLGDFLTAYRLLPQAQKNATTVTLYHGPPPISIVPTPIDGGLSGSLVGVVSLGDAPQPLTLADWTQPAGTENIVLALIEAPSTITEPDFGDFPVGSPLILDGEVVVASNLTLVMAERRNRSVLLRKAGGGRFSVYFDNEGSPIYPDAKLYIQTSASRVIPLEIGNTGTGFNNWTYEDDNDRPHIEGISGGDRFILAITTPAVLVISPVAIDGDLAGDLVGSLVLGDAPVIPPLVVTPSVINGGLAGDLVGSLILGSEPTIPPLLISPVAIDGGLAGDLVGGLVLGAEPTTPPLVIAPVVIDGGLSGNLVGSVALGAVPQDRLRESAYAAETEEVWLVLLTLSHPDLPDDIRIVNNTEPIQSRGQDYVPLAFDIVLPSDTEERPPLAEVRIDNVSRDLTESIRSISDAPTATIEVIVASNPDEAVVSYTGFRLIGIGWDAADVTGQLVLDDISIEPYPAGRFTPASFPGLF